MNTSSTGASASSPAQMTARATVKKEMDECEKDIQSLKAAITNLDLKQYLLKTKLNSTTPIMKLPLEIMSNIFNLVVQSQDKHNTRLLPAPFLLGKICKAWRDIVWTTPRLWSFVTISLDGFLYMRKELLREWLDRSGNSLLHFYITFSSKMAPLLHLDTIASLVLKTSSRWKTFVTRPFPALSEEMAKKHFKFPNLTVLHINSQKNDDLDGSHDFSRAPLLQTIRLSGFDVMESMTFCWEKLVVVHLDSPFLFEDAVAIIKKLKVIQKLHIHIERSSRSVPSTVPPPVPTNLPVLSELHVGSTGDGICSLLNCMKTPLLKELEINHLDVHGGELWVRALAQLHRRSPFSLSHLSFEEADIKELDLVSLLRTLSSLRSFYFSAGRKFKFSSDMIEHFQHGTFLPNLTYFSYKGSISFSVRALEDAINQRLSASHRIKSLKVLRNLNISYRNKSWTANEAKVNPNQLQAFYRKIDNIQSRGTTLNIVWDEKADKQRLDSDSD